MTCEAKGWQKKSESNVITMLSIIKIQLGESGLRIKFDAAASIRMERRENWIFGRKGEKSILCNAARKIVLW